MKDTEFDTRIDAFFRERDARSDTHLKMLKETDDLTALLLKGHLIAEELITTAIEAYCREPHYLSQAKLRFGQRVALLRALERIPSAPQTFWDAVLLLNKLRNELAHNLEQERVPALSAKFVTMLEKYRRQGHFPKPFDGREALIQALYFTLGGLEVISIWQHGVEELVANKLRSD